MHAKMNAKIRTMKMDDKRRNRTASRATARSAATAATAAMALAAALAMPHAHATEFSQVQPAQSSIAFKYQQMGVDMDGKFKRFNSELSFDPEQATKARARFDIELTSIDTGTSESDEEVAGKSWFNTKAFPTASFVSSSVKPLGNNRYEVRGKLSIKGKTQDVVVPASFSARGKTGVFDGSLTIKRGDFAIGEGAWAKFDIVANDVIVKFHITANAK